MAVGVSIGLLIAWQGPAMMCHCKNHIAMTVVLAPTCSNAGMLVMLKLADICDKHCLKRATVLLDGNHRTNTAGLQAQWKNSHLQLQLLSQLQSASSPAPPPPGHVRLCLTLPASTVTKEDPAQLHKPVQSLLQGSLAY